MAATNDEGGIRHAILESKTIGFEDASFFFLVVCSAFVNYVEAKVAVGHGGLTIHHAQGTRRKRCAP